jgi:hypothetical protein
MKELRPPKEIDPLAIYPIREREVGDPGHARTYPKVEKLESGETEGREREPKGNQDSPG